MALTSVRNGKAIGALQVVDDDEIMMITNGGKIIRTYMKNVRVIGRNTLGVNLFDLPEGEKVVAMDRVAEPPGSTEGLPAVGHQSVSHNGHGVH